MTADVVWLDQARDDVDELLAYLYPENPSAALRYIDDLEQACAGLANFPMRGFQYNERYRAIVVRNHMVFYRWDADENKLVIAAVIDSRRDLPRFLEDR